jgi:PAS domain S-box-containing protein
MIIPFTSIVYFAVTMALAILTFRFYREWTEDNAKDSLFYFLAFASLSFVCSAGIFTGTLFTNPDDIALMVIISNYGVALANSFFAYLYVYYRFPKKSPWWGFSIVFVFGIAVSIIMGFTKLEPALEQTGGVNWGVPVPIGVLRALIYFIGMFPLITYLYKDLRASTDRNKIMSNLFHILFLGFALSIAIFDFIIEPLSGFHALVSELLILVLAVICVIVYTILYEKVASRNAKRFRRLVDNMLDLVCLTNSQGIIQYANAIHESKLGYRAGELKGKNIFNLVIEEDLEIVKTNIQFTKTEPNNNRFEFRFQHADGQPVWMETFGSFILDEKEPDDVASFVLASRDITERKALENSLRQSQKMEAVGLLAGGVAHDFNNLLTVINGYTDIILSKLEQDNPNYNYLQQVKKSGKRASSLTRQLLAFSRRQILKPEVIDINKLTLDMEKMLRRLVREDIEFKSIFDDSLKLVQADPGQIDQVLLNLVVNASDAMPSGGKLTIETQNDYLDEHYVSSESVAKAGEYVRLTVSDTGIGMDKETRERIFEPFFTTKEKGKGTGLGLATVYGIVKQSHGTIWVYSELGRGTTFKVYLPVAAQSEVEKVEQPKTVDIKGNESILVIEDDNAVRMMAVEGLKELGYNVYDVPDGPKGIDLVKANGKTIDLLLTDVVMPNMSGREVADTIVPMVPNIKVLFMSGYTDNDIVHHGVLQEGINFIQKPFNVAALAHKIRTVLQN